MSSEAAAGHSQAVTEGPSVPLLMPAPPTQSLVMVDKASVEKSGDRRKHVLPDSDAPVSLVRTRFSVAPALPLLTLPPATNSAPRSTDTVTLVPATATKAKSQAPKPPKLKADAKMSVSPNVQQTSAGPNALGQQSVGMNSCEKNDSTLSKDKAKQAVGLTPAQTSTSPIQKASPPIPLTQLSKPTVIVIYLS